MSIEILINELGGECVCGTIVIHEAGVNHVAAHSEQNTWIIKPEWQVRIDEHKAAKAPKVAEKPVDKK